jgi:diketogulonate reductase-like aldo/keto reductase
MQHRRFGSSELQVPVIGQGTWNMERDRASAIAALRLGIELGMTHNDTAEMYGSGAVEELVAEAIAERRADVFLVSKVLPEHASKSGTITACERSLSRLKTDRLDCYLLHWRGRYPLSETVSAFRELQRAGKIVSWGVSNFDVPDLEELWNLAGEDGPVCNQVLYHLRERTIEHAVLPWCERHGIALTAYSPFGHNDFPHPKTLGGHVLQEVAAAHAATPRQVALAFLLRSPAVVAIPKASTPEHVRANARAGSIELSEAELARIDRAFPRAPASRALPML